VGLNDMMSGGLSRMFIGIQCRELKKLFRPTNTAHDTRQPNRT